MLIYASCTWFNRSHWRRWIRTSGYSWLDVAGAPCSLRMKFYGPNWTPITEKENDEDDEIFVIALSRVTKITLNDLRNFHPGSNRA